MNNRFNYPDISEALIKCLERDFPNQLPRTYTNAFEQGVLIGQQKIIDKLKAEKMFNEKYKNN